MNYRKPDVNLSNQSEFVEYLTIEESLIDPKCWSQVESIDSDQGFVNVDSITLMNYILLKIKNISCD